MMTEQRTMCEKCGRSVYWHWLEGRKYIKAYCYTGVAAAGKRKGEWNAGSKGEWNAGRYLAAYERRYIKSKLTGKHMFTEYRPIMSSEQSTSFTRAEMLDAKSVVTDLVEL